MMLTHVYSSIFNSPAQTLVNTVNIVGVMGKGIAKEFKDRYPPMFLEYRHLCSQKKLHVGDLHLWKSDRRWVLNFPTKTTWRLPSKIDYVESGLKTFVSKYKTMGITSAAFPPLGCGNGNLDWRDVKPLMVSYLKDVEIPIYMHDVQVGDGYVAEHFDGGGPVTFLQFVEDLRRATSKKGSTYKTGEAGQLYELNLLLDSSLQVKHINGKTEVIPSEEIESAWLKMKDGILSIDGYSDERSRRYKSYLFPLLASMPYIRSVSVRREGRPTTAKSQGLFFDRASFEGYREATAVPESDQRWLFP